MSLLQVITHYLKDPTRLPQLISSYFPRSKSIQKHIFIVGAPRSGTTLIKLILGAHPNLTGPGYETGFFTFKSFLKTLLEVDSNNSKKWNKKNYLRENSKDIIDFFDAYAKASLKNNGGKRFIEKTPSHVLRLNFLLEYFPNSQFINVVRDGRDCYCSARHHSNIKQNSSVIHYAKYWKKCINARLRIGNNPNIFDIKYEDLVNEPEKACRQMMMFLEEEYDPRQIDSSIYSKNSITKSKRPEFSKLSKAITASTINRYEKELSQQEIYQFERIASKELEFFGYKLNKK